MPLVERYRETGRRAASTEPESMPIGLAEEQMGAHSAATSRIGLRLGILVALMPMWIATLVDGMAKYGGTTLVSDSFGFGMLVLASTLTTASVLWARVRWSLAMRDVLERGRDVAN